MFEKSKCRPIGYVGYGGVAQLGERLLCKQDVIGSIPFTSTIALVSVALKDAAFESDVGLLDVS